MSQTIYHHFCPASSHLFCLPYDSKHKWIWSAPNRPPNNRMWQSHVGHWLTQKVVFLRVPQDFGVKDIDVIDILPSCHHCTEMAESLIYFCSMVLRAIFTKSEYEELWDNTNAYWEKHSFRSWDFLLFFRLTRSKECCRRDTSRN